MALGDVEQSIIRRLDILIALSLEQLTGEGKLTMADKICKLIELGVPPADTARILGKPLNYVTATLSQRKARKEN